MRETLVGGRRLIGVMKKSLLSFAGWVALPVALAMADPIPLYENFGTVTNIPQIDAIAFANYGAFDVGSVLPYDFQNTRFYTNRGEMSSIPGFRFDYVTDNGFRHSAANFVNAAGASIFSGSSTFFFFGFGQANENPTLIVSATNIVNNGLLSAGTPGLIRLTGQNLDLTRGGIEIQPINDAFAGFCFFGGSPFVSPTNFFPDPGITDLDWNLTNAVFNVVNLSPQIGANGLVNIDSPSHRVIRQIGGGFGQCYFTNFTQLFLRGATPYVNFTRPTPTNWLIEAAFVVNVDPTVASDVRLYPSSTFTNPYSTMVVGFTSPETNVVTGANTINTLYLIDTLASETNYVLLTNLNSSASCPTMMPGNFVLSRGTPCEYLLGRTVNSSVYPTIFFDPGTTITLTTTNGTNVTVTNITTRTTSTLATNLYGAYGAAVDNILLPVPPVPGATLTNISGRIEVSADNLNLNRTRMRGEGFINLQTKHLIGSENAAVDSENLSFSLGATNGNLTVKNLAKPTVERFSGTMSAWSATWTNLLEVDVDVITNGVSAGGFTNTILIGYHALLVDGGMNTLKQVVVYDFAAHSTNVVINDSMLVADSFLIDGERFTLNGQLSLLGGVAAESWTVGTAPQLRYFTNNGILNIPNRAWFGNDRAAPYSVFVNNGTLNAFTVDADVADFHNNGTMSASAGLTVAASTGTFEGGQLLAGGDMTLSGTDLRFLTHNCQASGVMSIRAINSLSDSGPSAGNSWNCVNGFDLPVKPRISSLLGTTLQTTAPQFGNPFHFWSADDFGANAAGYSNNAALGVLTLNVGFDGLLTFSGTGSSNGLYVDFLNLGTALKQAFTNDDLGSVLEIDNNLVIYFADASVSAEALDGQLGGHLRWVKDFAGPNSSVDVLLLNGQTVKMNRPLRFSTTIDTDGDGVANAFDFYPLDAAEWNSVTPPGGFWKNVSVSNSGSTRTVSLSWNAAPSTVYRVEYTPNLSTPNWQWLMTYSNFAVGNGIVTVLDTNVPFGDSQRFYRVLYGP